MSTPSPAFRAVFAAGADWGADTTSRLDQDSAVQQAWEQHGAGGERGRELDEIADTVSEALRDAEDGKFGDIAPTLHGLPERLRRLDVTGDES